MNIIEHTNIHVQTEYMKQFMKKYERCQKNEFPPEGLHSWAEHRQSLFSLLQPRSSSLPPSPSTCFSVSTCSFKISCSWCHQISSEKMTALVQWDSMSVLWGKSFKSPPPQPQLQALLLTVCRVASPISAGGRSVCESPGPQLVPGSSPLSRPSPVGLHYYTLGLHHTQAGHQRKPRLPEYLPKNIVCNPRSSPLGLHYYTLGLHHTQAGLQRKHGQIEYLPKIKLTRWVFSMHCLKSNRSIKMTIFL